MDISNVIDYLRNYNGEDICLMEICGTHTASIAKNAIADIISDKIHLVSGPGCPVCVTVSDYVDRLIALARDGSAIVTFGDMIRVPGSEGSLADIKGEGADIRMVYSPVEAISLAKAEPERDFVFACVGFETTTPIYAVLIEEIIKEKIKNLRLLTALKTMPSAVDMLCRDGGRTDGFIAPGHVCTVAGSSIFEALAEEHSIPFVVSGFEAEEILASIYALVRLRGKGRVLNLYKGVAPHDRNERAHKLVSKYFEPCDAAWRGLGIIKGSGIALREEYAQLDAGSRELLNDISHSGGCKCAEIITGKSKPCDCPLYAGACTPESPKGACIVSSEGACHSYYINNRSF